MLRDRLCLYWVKKVSVSKGSYLVAVAHSGEIYFHSETKAYWNWGNMHEWTSWNALSPNFHLNCSRFQVSKKIPTVMDSRWHRFFNFLIFLYKSLPFFGSLQFPATQLLPAIRAFVIIWFFFKKCYNETNWIILIGLPTKWGVSGYISEE